MVSLPVDDYPMDPPPVGEPVPFTAIFEDGVLVTPHLGSRSWAAKAPVRAARRENRLQLVVAGLAGAVVALAWIWAVDRG